MPFIAISEEDEGYIDPRTCDNCGDVFDYDIDGYGTECGSVRCEDCGPQCECVNHEDDYGDYESSSSHDGRIFNYSYRPAKFRPKGNYPAEVLMGVELEVGGYQEGICNAASLVDPYSEHLYVKEDGSISGAEIVTHPMTLDWARTFDVRGGGAGGFDAMLLELRNNNHYVDEGYGLHIHVSRNAFRKHPKSKRSATHQLTWLLFLYRNASQLEELARRDPAEWGAFNETAPGELNRKAHGERHDSARYLAVNCQNERTYEMRFFASTLSGIEFWAALEFADASVEYTRTLKASDVMAGNALMWGQFVAWINDEARNGRYSNLAIEVAAQGLDSDDWARETRVPLRRRPAPRRPRAQYFVEPF